jgi:hypothetical protein
MTQKEYDEVMAGLNRNFCEDKGEECEFEDRLCCRECMRPDLELIDVSSRNDESGVLRPVAEPLCAYYCNNCEMLTMVSRAAYCSKCGACAFLQSQDEEIFDNTV